MLGTGRLRTELLNQGSGEELACRKQGPPLSWGSSKRVLSHAREVGVVLFGGGRGRISLSLPDSEHEGLGPPHLNVHGIQHRAGHGVGAPRGLVK